jgi:DNA sulfur modification protein DndD
MKIDMITLNDFRQYHSSVSIDLQTDDKRNIVLIGGKNGYGKTNLLIALVWCLYGEKISQVDDHFKQEIQKESNYSKFMKQSLNWDTLNKGGHKFSVELVISDIQMPELTQRESASSHKCVVKRTFDTNSMNEQLSIYLPDSSIEIFESEEDKMNFINDYLIPIEAGKFVFFDAEKIASLAELSTKDEGTVMNDAFGKLLGLDIYKSLEEDFRIFVNNLKKDGANENVRDQIINCENTIDLNKIKIEEIDQKIANNESEIKKKKQLINELESFLNNYSKQDAFAFNRESILNQKTALEKKEKDLGERFNELSEIIPLAMLAGKLDEVAEYIQLQEQNRYAIESNSELKQRFDSFIERLFNHPPDPEDSTMPFKAKVFYSQKAQNLFDSLFDDKPTIPDLDFDLDLSNSDKELLFNAIDLIKQNTKEQFEQTIENYNSVQNDIQELDKTLRKIDANLQDDFVLEYLIKKDDEVLKVEKLIKENGSLESQKADLIKQNSRETQRSQVLIQKVNVTQQRKQKLEKANLYIAALQEFSVLQKKHKKENLSRNIYLEMQKLMHKLQSKDNNFIAEVKVDILPDDTGLKVTLFDKEGRIIPKENLSQGEKQLYISSLLKAIFSEAIQNFPVFIDTPLGRLDDEHIKNILLYYYPDLAEQVIILATNNEITPKRYHDLKDNIAKSYLLDNYNNNTTFKPGYFQSYEN